MQIAKDSFVVIEYSLRLDDGWFVKGENVPASMNFIAGYGQILPALENGLIGLEQGAQTELKIPAREAFGERDEDHGADHVPFRISSRPRSGARQVGDSQKRSRPGRSTAISSVKKRIRPLRWTTIILWREKTSITV